eukprot:scaffold2516_cov108-Isochrysis_galbana.AAC.18
MQPHCLEQPARRLERSQVESGAVCGRVPVQGLALQNNAQQLLPQRRREGLEPRAPRGREPGVGRAAPLPDCHGLLAPKLEPKALRLGAHPLGIEARFDLGRRGRMPTEALAAVVVAHHDHRHLVPRVDLPLPFHVWQVIPPARDHPASPMRRTNSPMSHPVSEREASPSKPGFDLPVTSSSAEVEPSRSCRPLRSSASECSLAARLRAKVSPGGRAFCAAMTSEAVKMAASASTTTSATDTSLTAYRTDGT